ncbi:5501_t:CDS:2 [Entrophospora sp. SA101]|nr:5501_t:CDS:2 [Entrophospora sp. SA101]
MPATRKHLHISKPRRRQRSVSLNTRASRCGVKNFLNVLKSLHPTVDSFFPVTKQYLQEYIDAKKKQGTIKANSLDQYFQHIESYNMALNYGEIDDLNHHNPISNDLPTIPLVCFDVTHDPIAKIERSLRVSIANIDQNDDPNLVIQQLTNNISNLKLPKKWGTIDTTTLYYRIAPLTPRKSPPRLQQIPGLDYNSVTIRSPNRTYKQNIAITDKTTFSSLLAFAIKKPPPPGKQFVLQSADGELEYMPEDPVRKVIHGTLHADVVVKMEDINERYVAKSLQHSGFARTFRKYLDNHDKRMIVEHVLYENGIGLLDDIDSYLEII